MLEIEYKGGNALQLSTKKSTLVCDPRISMLGVKDVPVKGAIELATEARFSSEDAAGVVLAIEGPGEYEVGDFSIHGVPAIRHIDAEADGNQSTLYRIEAAGVRIALLGNIADVLTEDQYEALGVVDVVIIPVGGGGLTLDSVSAVKIVRQLDPKVVIPVHYADAGLDYEVPQDSVDTFIHELSVQVEEVSSKYKIKSLSTLPDVLTVVKINRV